MTREMNKPDWHNKWMHGEICGNDVMIRKQRVLDEDWRVFFERCCNMEKI